MTIADYTLPSIFIGLALLIYGSVYYRYAQSMKALGDNAHLLPLTTANSRKVERFFLVVIAAVAGISIVRGILQGWQAALPGAIQVSAWLVFSGTQNFARHFWVGARGFVHLTKFIAWSDVETLAWDNDIHQQQWGLTLRYRDNNQSKTLRLWIPRKKQLECAQMLANYSGVS